MFPVYGIGLDFITEDTLDGVDPGTNCFSGHELEDIEVLRPTGLIHKKTNKEIYEGDVFRQEVEEDYGDERTYNVVTWIRERAAFYLIPTGTYEVYLDNDLENEEAFEWLFDQAALYDFSIDVSLDLCGNIYENPELLK